MGWLSDIWSDVKEGVKDLGRWIDDEILQPVKDTVVATVKGIKENPLNAILTIAALAAGQPQLLPYINAGTALAAGAKPEDVLKAAAAAYVASYVTSGVIKSDIAKTLIGDSKLVENIATGGIRGGLTAALQGKDFGEGVVSGVINQGVAYGMQQFSNYTGAMVKEKFPEFITTAKELGKFVNFTPAGPRALNIYREDDGSKFIYDNDGNILGGVDTEGNSIIGNKGTYVVVGKDNKTFGIYNLAGEAIGGERVGGEYGALGDLSDFGDKAKIDIMAENKFKVQYPNAKSYEERELAWAKINQLQTQMNALDYNDPAQGAQFQDLYNQVQDTWDQLRGVGKYAPDYQAPEIQAKDPNQLEQLGRIGDGRTFHTRPDGLIEVKKPDGSLERLIDQGTAKNVYGVQIKPYVDPNTVLPEPVRPPDSEYIQQDQQEGPVAPEISGPMPQPVPPVVEPIALEPEPTAPTTVAPIPPGSTAPTAPVAPTAPTAPVSTAPVAPAPPAAPVAVSGDRELTGGPAWARDWKVIERANGQVDFIDRATGQITGQLTFTPGGNLEFDRELRAQFRYAEPVTPPTGGLLTDLVKPVEIEIGRPIEDTGPTGPTTITPIPPGATEPVGQPIVLPPATVEPVDLIPQPPLGGGLRPPTVPGTGGQTGITPGAGGETGVVAPPQPPPPAEPIDTTMPPITLLPPTGAPTIGDGQLGTGIVPGTGGETGITPGAGGETGLLVPTPPPVLEPITTTPTPEQPLGPITPVQENPVAPPPTTPQDPPIPQQSQFPSADKWLEALQRYLTNTFISAATRGIVNGLVSEAQRLVSGGPSPVTPTTPTTPTIPTVPGAPSTGGTDFSWLGGLLGGTTAAGLTTTAARAAPVTYGQQRVSYDEAPEAPVFESGSAILDRDPTRTFLG